MVVLAAVLASPMQAQSRKLKVISTDSTPVVYAFVQLEGGVGQITDENGEISIGAGKTKTFTVNVRRIGFTPWFGKLEFPDTSATLTVIMPRLAQGLAEVRISERAKAPAYLQPFYDRWTMKQKGLLSATFIGPEELEFRHPDRIANMLSGLNGVALRRGNRGEMSAMSTNGTCPMAVVVDGVQKCPRSGCTGGSGGMSLGARAAVPLIDINDLVDANDVAAIEVYTRGGNTPTSLQVNDTACGVIAIWTGSRKP